MLVTVIMIFLVMSFTGVATMEVAHSSAVSSLQTRNNIRAQLLMESTINRAMWLINTGEDSLVNQNLDGAIVSFDASAQRLSVQLDTLNNALAIDLNLGDKTHFDYGMTTISGVADNGFTYSQSLVSSPGMFNFLPGVDIPYWEDNALVIETANQHSWKGDDYSQSGIYVFKGNNLTLDSLQFINSTLVFTGRYINLSNSVIQAAVPSDSLDAQPALIFTNPDVSVTLDSSNIINGAIYCAGELNIDKAYLTGPVISERVGLLDDIIIHADAAKSYYRWTSGFGNRSDYDWPKHINRWVTSQWDRDLDG